MGCYCQHCEVLCKADAALKLRSSWPEHRLHALRWPESMLSPFTVLQCQSEAVTAAASSFQQRDT